jgi:formate-dependent nitrite reductase cytochrome c552 subunit
MVITKKRTATRKEQKCHDCGRTIAIKESYFDTDEKIGKRPWDTAKVCTECQATHTGAQPINEADLQKAQEATPSTPNT